MQVTTSRRLDGATGPFKGRDQTKPTRFNLSPASARPSAAPLSTLHPQHQEQLISLIKTAPEFIRDSSPHFPQSKEQRSLCCTSQFRTLVPRSRFQCFYCWCSFAKTTFQPNPHLNFPLAVSIATPHPLLPSLKRDLCRTFLRICCTSHLRLWYPDLVSSVFAVGLSLVGAR
jgi:hypothetical protein